MAQHLRRKRRRSIRDPASRCTLAEERARRISDLRYDLRFAIPADQAAPVTGRVSDHVHAEGRVASAGARLRAAGARHRRPPTAPMSPSPATMIIVLPAARLREGRNEISLEFVAGDAALNRNAEFLYTLFVPARAHLAFPCFDQPDLKARWTLALDVPDGWQAVANGAVTTRREDAVRKVHADIRRHAAALDVSLRVRRRPVLDRDRRARAAARSGCCIAKPTPPRSRATATRSSTCTPSALAWLEQLHRQSRIRGASSTSSSCRRSSSAAWSIPARSSTTPRRCCSIRPRRRTRSSAAPA